VEPESRRQRGETADGWREYLFALGTVTLITVAGIPLPDDYYLAIGLVYLLGIILLSLRVGHWAALLASIMAVAVWDHIFVLPRYDFSITNLSDALAMLPYSVVAVVAGQLTVWIRGQTRNEKRREQRATTLLQLTRALAAANTLDEAATVSLRQAESLFGAQMALLLAPEAADALAPHSAGGYLLDAREFAAASQAFQQRQPTGRFTANQPDSAGYYVPMLLSDRAVGVLGAKSPPRSELKEGQRELLDVFARQFALIVEREHLRAASEREKLLAASDKLHRTLLESVSHELRTPLAVITAAVENLPEADAATQVNLVAEVRAAAGRLNRLVGNLLDQTRLDSGALKPRLSWCDARDIINAAVEATRGTLAGHPISINLSEEFPPVRADFGLTEQALANLLLNVARHTPGGTTIEVSAGVEAGGARVFFAVADNGPGFPPALRERLFHKFARGETARAGGLGLGLSLVRGFIAAQGGEAVADNRAAGGALITLYLPRVSPKNPPPE
jgi:two-component system sensor histidine kinase KdpD